MTSRMNARSNFCGESSAGTACTRHSFCTRSTTLGATGAMILGTALDELERTGKLAWKTPSSSRGWYVLLNPFISAGFCVA
ncbi:MAG: hypothetical protein HC794_10440 [Nitrospiraceae bacterium]|nr:hypothetical protein [Nitrospiraceae bacterium]